MSAVLFLMPVSFCFMVAVSWVAVSMRDAICFFRIAICAVFSSIWAWPDAAAAAVAVGVGAGVAVGVGVGAGVAVGVAVGVGIGVAAGSNPSIMLLYLE